MIKNIIFIGGDGRTVEAAKTLKKAGFGVRLVGFEKYESGDTADAKVRKRDNPEAGTQRIDGTEIGLSEDVCVVLPTPCSKDGQTLFAPFAQAPLYISEVRKMLRGAAIVVGGGAKKYFSEAVDLLEREDFKILNAVPSAEGAGSRRDGDGHNAFGRKMRRCRVRKDWQTAVCPAPRIRRRRNGNGKKSGRFCGGSGGGDTHCSDKKHRRGSCGSGHCFQHRSVLGHRRKRVVGDKRNGGIYRTCVCTRRN